MAEQRSGPQIEGEQILSLLSLVGICLGWSRRAGTVTWRTRHSGGSSAYMMVCFIVQLKCVEKKETRVPGLDNESSLQKCRRKTVGKAESEPM